MLLLEPKYIKLVIAMLNSIRYELDRCYWNKYQKSMNSPFDNTGETYKNKTFTVRAYDWNIDDDKKELPNFDYKNILHVYWYKHSGRCVTVYYDGEYNFNIDFLANILNDCIDSIRNDFGDEEND